MQTFTLGSPKSTFSCWFVEGFSALLGGERGAFSQPFVDRVVHSVAQSILKSKVGALRTRIGKPKGQEAIGQSELHAQQTGQEGHGGFPVTRFL